MKLLALLLPSLEERFAFLQARAEQNLMKFYDPEIRSFAVEPGVSRFSVTSTCYALDALNAIGKTIDTGLLEADWREDDLFQLPLVVFAASRLDDGNSPRLQKAIEMLCSSRARLGDDLEQRLSGYLQYWLAAALIETKRTDSEVTFALERAHDVARNEMCRQIAYHVSGDSAFDVTRLAYSLLTYSKTKSDKLVSKGLEAFFEKQLPDGLWPPGQSIYSRSRRSFDLGNAFVFSPDLVGALLESLPAQSFKPYLTHLERLLTWIEEHHLNGGWCSPHLNDVSIPLAWSTAQVLKCVAMGRTVTQQLLNAEILEEFGGNYVAGRVPNVERWEGLLDSDLDASTTLKEALGRVLRQEAWSAVLFGPPGTAKTTTAEAVADCLGYDFLVVDTSTFLENGLTNVGARVAYVFGRLKKLENTVILFDEIEEFCLDRKDPRLAMESRMLTTAMLTQLNDLRKSQKSPFFIATNRIGDFDSAITRPGRIDLLLFVGPPRLVDRVERFKLLTDDENAIREFSDFLQETWTTDSRYLNFMESERFAKEAAAAYPDWDLSKLLREHSKVMLIRDEEARTEFDNSIKLSRL